MLGISEAAEAIGFRTQGVRITVEELERNVPYLHTALEPMAFRGLLQDKEREVLHSGPAAGLITYTKEEFKRCWVSTKVDGQDTGTRVLAGTGPEFVRDGGRGERQET